jgi:hypothetical protein
MFIIIIVVIGIVLYLANLNSRINSLENKLSNINTVQKSENISVITPQPQIQPNVEMQKEVIIKTPIAPHQDNFAQNLAKFGIAILVLGVLFFLNYLDKQGLIGPVFKYIAGLSFGILLLGIAEYLKNKSQKYTNLLRGAAFIIFYLTLFIGYIMFKIVALPLTLGLVMAVLAVSTIISIRENDELPFTIGVLGAYMLSFLVNVNFYNLNQENTLGILSYILILNIAVLIVAFIKQWINSAVIGFIFTWVIFVSIMSADIGKGMLFIFSTVYGLQYLIMFLLQDFKKDKIIHNTVFLTVINTLVYLMIFYKLVVGTVLFDYVGFFVALLGVFHFMIYMLLKNINTTSKDVISLTHFVIAILLLTVAVPLQFDGPLVTMIWFFEGLVLSFLSVLKDFKNKPLMYVLGFASIVAGISHMIMFGDYENVLETGRILLNQSYIVWFGVFALINVVAYVWYNTVTDSEDVVFKNSVTKAAFGLILIGQVMFVALTSYEINSFGKYRVNIVNNEINTQMELDRKLNADQNNYSYNYDYSKYENEREKINGINKQTTFMQILLFIFMTIIYFVVGLVNKNKIVRNMGIVTLVITSVLLITLTWQLGPVYRIITFVGFGILLLIISYLYISKNKKLDIAKTIVLFLAITSFSHTVDAKIIELKNWTTIGDITLSQIDVDGNSQDHQNLYVLPINKDVITMSKKYDLSDIRLMDKDKNEIPYILIKSNQQNQQISDSTVDVKILENSTARDGKKVLVIDTNREGVLYNNLYLSKDANSKNFRKKIKVYISDSFLTSNSTAWKEFEQKNVLYNYTDETSFVVENMNINLAGVSSRYIKIELTNDTDFDKNIKVNNQLSITGAEVKYLQNEDKNIGYTVKDYLSGNFAFNNLSIYKDVNLLDKIESDSRTELIYEGDIDVEEFILSVDSNEKNFNRNIVIQGAQDDANWVTFSNGSIYRINSPVYKGENLSIKISPSTYKKFKVIVQNNNNKPLDISKIAKVKIQNTGLLFKYDAGVANDLKIVVGNNIESAPIYDIRNTINYFEGVTPKIIQYNNLLKNPEYVPQKQIIPFGEKNKVLLNIGLLIFILIIGIFGFFWMKNTHHE